MAFIEIDEEDFDVIIEREFAKGHTVILKFGSTFCDGCQLMEFELEEVHDRVTKLSILDIDSGLCGALVQRFDVEQVPATLIFKDRETQLLYKSGIMLADDIVELILKER
jgi:thioredoxin-like negative regulator of GroEL